jgi:hypothetical protein
MRTALLRGGLGTPRRYRRPLTAALSALVILGLGLAAVAGTQLASRRAAAIGSSVTFAPPISYLRGTQPQQTAVGDFNGDGAPDLISVSPWSNVCDSQFHCTFIPATVNVLLNNGHGALTPVATPALTGHGTDNAYTSVVTGDFNHDGHLDAAVLDSRANTIEILLGNGDGTFLPTTAATTIVFPSAGNAIDIRYLATGDFTGDGNLDLVTANGSGYYVGTVSVLLGHGDGTFAPPSLAPGPGSNTFATGGLSEPVFLTVGDFDGDGKLDVATLNVDTYGMGAVGLDAPRSAWINTSYSVLLSDGAGNLSLANGSPIVDPNSSPSAMAVGDFNGDGRSDLAITSVVRASGVNQVAILLGQPNGTFVQASAAPALAPGQNGLADIEVGDFNGDGRLDMLVLAQNGFMNVFTGNGDGTFQSPIVFTESASTGQYASAVVGDFNRDGLSDIAITTPEAVSLPVGSVTVLLNTTVVVPLTFTASLGAPHSAANSATYVASATPIMLTGNEPGGTVSSLSYRMYPQHGTPPPFTSVTGSAASIHLTGADGVYELDYYATDAQGYGGAADAHHLTLTLDNTPPLAAIAIGQPRVTQDGVTYVTEGTPLTLAADDGGGSGVASLAYRFYPVGATPPAYTTTSGATATFTLSGPNGAYEVDYDATDQLGNDPAAKLLVTLTQSFPGADTAGPAPAAPTAWPLAPAATPTAGALAAASDQSNAPPAVLPRATRGVVARRAVASPWGALLALGAVLALLGLAGLGAVLYRVRQQARAG